MGNKKNMIMKEIKKNLKIIKRKRAECIPKKFRVTKRFALFDKRCQLCLRTRIPFRVFCQHRTYARDITKRKPDQEPKDTQDHSCSRIYVETDILEKLSAVLTAPKIEKAKVLDIQYFLHWYTKSGQFSKQEQLPVYTSRIPYR